MNREQWLNEVAARVEPTFRGFRLRPFRVTCGWPSHGAYGGRKVVLGQCFGVESSKDGTSELFVSPLVDDPLKAAGVLCHELAHVAAGVEAKHAGRFVAVCRYVGLTKGRWTEVMPGLRLQGTLQEIVAKVGPYPHSAIKPVAVERKPPSSTGLVCPECGCRVTISFRWLDDAGLPTCACGTEFEIKE